MSEDPTAWAVKWLDSVAYGRWRMSQRILERIESTCGMAVLRRLAKDRGVHLLQLTDDKGNQLVAASRHPFKVIS